MMPTFPDLTGARGLRDGLQIPDDGDADHREKAVALTARVRAATLCWWTEATCERMENSVTPRECFGVELTDAHVAALTGDEVWWTVPEWAQPVFDVEEGTLVMPPVTGIVVLRGGPEEEEPGLYVLACSGLTVHACVWWSVGVPWGLLLQGLTEGIRQQPWSPLQKAATHTFVEAASYWALLGLFVRATGEVQALDVDDTHGRFLLLCDPAEQLRAPSEVH